MTITTRRDSADATDSAECEKIHLQKLVGQLKSNLYSVSVLSEADLELLSNMDPNSVADITGKDFIEQLKETSGRLARQAPHLFRRPLSSVRFPFNPTQLLLNRCRVV